MNGIFIFIILSINIINTFQEEIQPEKNNNFYGPLTKEESIKEVEALYQEFISSENIQAQIKNLQNLKDTLSLSKEPDCVLCTTIMTFSRSIIHDQFIVKHGSAGLYIILEKLCSNFMNKDVCHGAIYNYGEVVLTNILNLATKPEGICYKVGACDKKIPYIYKEEYAQRVLKDKPKTIKKVVNPLAPTFKMLQFADIHLDLEYKEGAITECDKPICCQELPKNNENISEEKLAGHYGHLGKCDGSIEIVKEFAKQVKLIKPDVILFSGDVISHKVWDMNQETVTNTTKVLIDTITKEIGYEIPILPTIGNHEKYTVDQYYGEEKELLEGFGGPFKPFLSEEAYNLFTKYGYYSQKFKNNTKLKFIALNCLMCDSFNLNLLTNTSEPKKMFDWLEEELKNSEINNESVYIHDHIGQSNSQHLLQCAFRLRVLIDRYQNIIKGYLSAHSHNEYMQLVHDWNSTNPIMVNYIASTIGTYNGYNPSYRVYYIDSSTFLIKDFTQYRFDLLKSNKEKKPFWFESYNATKLFNVTDLTDVVGISNMKIEGDYIIKKFTDTQKGYDKAYDEGEILIIKCDFSSNDFYEIMQCKGQKPGFYKEYFYYILNLLQGNWKERDIY